MIILWSHSEFNLNTFWLASGFQPFENKLQIELIIRILIQLLVSILLYSLFWPNQDNLQCRMINFFSYNGLQIIFYVHCLATKSISICFVVLFNQSGVQIQDLFFFVHCWTFFRRRKIILFLFKSNSQNYFELCNSSISLLHHRWTDCINFMMKFSISLFIFFSL